MLNDFVLRFLSFTHLVGFSMDLVAFVFGFAVELVAIS